MVWSGMLPLPPPSLPPPPPPRPQAPVSAIAEPLAQPPSFAPDETDSTAIVAPRPQADAPAAVVLSNSAPTERDRLVKDPAYLDDQQ